MRVIVLHSGGLDSTTCILLAKERGHDVSSLGIDYNQRNRIELDFAAKQCQEYDIPRKIITVSWDKPHRDIPLNRPLDQIGRDVSPAFLPGRNAVFLVLACAEASGLGADEVWIGVNTQDYSGYPDCRAEFVDAFRKMIELAIPGGAAIVAPLQDMSKPDIAKEAYRLGIRPGGTWSCYRPQEKDGTYAPCGECDACVLHQHAWDAALQKE